MYRIDGWKTQQLSLGKSWVGEINGCSHQREKCYSRKYRCTLLDRRYKVFKEQMFCLALTKGNVTHSTLNGSTVVAIAHDDAKCTESLASSFPRGCLRAAFFGWYILWRRRRAASCSRRFATALSVTTASAAMCAWVTSMRPSWTV